MSLSVLLLLLLLWLRDCLQCQNNKETIANPELFLNVTTMYFMNLVYKDLSSPKTQKQSLMNQSGTAIWLIHVCNRWIQANN